jgi:formylglycine-generating enzyme required for sulfatase activity
MKHKFSMMAIAALAAVLLGTCDNLNVQDIIDSVKEGVDGSVVGDDNGFGFTAVSLREGEALAGMKAGDFSGGLTVTMADGEDAAPDNARFTVSPDSTELLTAQDLAGGPHHITFRVSAMPASLPKQEEEAGGTEDEEPAGAPDDGAWFIHEAIIFVDFSGGPSELNFEQDYRLMTGTAVARGLMPVGTFDPQGGLAPYSYSLVPGTGENSEHNALFRGGDGIYAKRALEAGEYKIYVRCTTQNGLFKNEALTLTVAEYTPPAFLSEKDYVYFPETEVEGNIDFDSRIFLQDRNLTIPAFALSKYEVTQAAFWEVYSWAIADERGDNKYTFINPKSILPTSKPSVEDAGKPQIVCWLDAALWLNAFSEKQTLTPVYYTYATDNEENKVVMRTFNTTTASEKVGTGNSTVYKNNNIYIDWEVDGYRLPCEVEWEFAARGGEPLLVDGSPWLFGFAGTNDYEELITKYAYTSYLASVVNPTGATLVGSFMPNTAGLYDMTGNVSEWAGDIFLDSYVALDAATPLRGVTGYRGGSADNRGISRVSRGGDFEANTIGMITFNIANQTSTKERTGNGLSAQSIPTATGMKNPGFRIARTITGN